MEIRGKIGRLYIRKIKENTRKKICRRKKFLTSTGGKKTKFLTKLKNETSFGL
jgi:hypothetical protein